MFVNRCLTLAYCFNGCYGREIGWGPTNQSSGVLWIKTGALFLEVVGSVQLYWINMKGCRVWLVMSAHVSYVSDFSYRMYLNSNCRESRI
jgi:hypothetical protein